MYYTSTYPPGEKRLRIFSRSFFYTRARSVAYHQVCLHPVNTLFQKNVTTFFYDKMKQNCPFTKIFGTLITKSRGHRQVYLVSYLTYFVQLLYLGKLLRPKYHEISLKLLIFSMLQYYNINCKTVAILFYSLFIQLTVYNRTITRFIINLSSHNTVQMTVQKQTKIYTKD